MNEVKGKEVRKSGRQVKERLHLDSEAMFQRSYSMQKNTTVVYCNEVFSFSKPRKSWLRCIKLQLWAHCDCAGVKMSQNLHL
jgi:hypothetical protein